ncbi:hypothetical protein ACFQE1_22005, partial [Halobium palmae]
MIRRPDRWTLGIGLLGVLVLFVPIPLVTQLIGLPMVVYACYRYWGRDDLGAESWGVRDRAGAFVDGVASVTDRFTEPNRTTGPGADSDRT